ncbi:hypothetical protein MUN89_15705 [Halobacillus salinarum]|uniref:Phage protein n=1 Tax=Halobacillus salinarum TaxID=2932257 RepID=A0ABY4EFV3_9BACI|nr:hypothetical protein [Halobacillus salinarum]UOQ43356.1 hypothetical protein MUN89_15705 [Halobacillus salinarum]
MPLFEGNNVTEIVTADDIKKLTGISTNDFRFPNEDDQEKALDDLLNRWIKQIASHIRTRLGHPVFPEDEEYEAMQDIVTRTVAKLVATAQQQRSSPIIQINDFAVSVINTAEVTKDINKELKPFQERRVSVFSSLDDFHADA